jgi:hypothetical protein
MSSTNPTGTVVVTTNDAAQLSMARTSLVTPGYVLKKATGSLPENTYGFSESYFTALQGVNSTKTIHTPSFWTHTLTTGNIGPLWNLISPFSSVFKTAVRLNQSNEIKARLAKKMIDSDIDLSVVAGEFRETTSMFKDLATRLMLARKALGRGDFGALSTALSLRNNKDWANAWLLANYGIKPLVKDLLGGIKALEKGLMKETYYVQSTRTKFADDRLQISGTPSSGITTTNWRWEVESSARVKYTITDAQVSTLASLGLVNPFGLAWELTKLSFVIDWAIGVGAWLNQLGAAYGKDFSTGSITVFERLTGHSQFTRNGTFGSTTYKVNGVRTYSNVSCNRTGYLTMPVAWLPAIKDPLSLFTVTTSLALLRQSHR